MTFKQKAALYLELVALLMFILLIWAVFAYTSKTDVGSFILELGTIVTFILAALSALFGFHSGQSGQGNAVTLPPGTQVRYSPPVTVLNTSVSAPPGADPAIPPSDAQQ